MTLLGALRKWGTSVNRYSMFVVLAFASSISMTASPVVAQVDSSPVNLSAPGPGASREKVSAVSDTLMTRYQPDRTVFAGVFIDGPSSIRVALKDSRADRQEIIDGVVVTFVPVRYSLDELIGFAGDLLKVNPALHTVDIASDRDLLVGVTAMIVAQAPPIARPVSIPVDVQIGVTQRDAGGLDAAEGAMLVSSSGCTSGFRINGNRISTAEHCSNTWGSINGVAITHSSYKCAIDNQLGSGSSLSSVVGGYTFSGSQYDPAVGDSVWKYGVATGWSNGTAYTYSVVSSTKCNGVTVPAFNITVQLYQGMSHSGGDSGGPYISVNGSTYVARGTHRGYQGAYTVAIPISTLVASGWPVS